MAIHPDDELERVKITAEDFFSSTGRRDFAFFALHQNDAPVLNIRLRPTIDDRDLRHAVCEASAVSLLWPPQALTLTLPTKIKAAPAFALMLFAHDEASVRTFSPLFGDDGKLLRWYHHDPDDVEMPDMFFLTHMAFMLKKPPKSDIMLPEALLTTLTKRGHEIFVSDETIRSRWLELV